MRAAIDILIGSGASFAAGAYRLSGGDWQRLIVWNHDDVTQPGVVTNFRWQSGVTGTFVAWPRGMRLDKAELLGAISEPLGVTAWDEGRRSYQDKPEERPAVRKCLKLLKSFQMGAYAFDELAGHVFVGLSFDLHYSGNREDCAAVLEILPRELLRAMLDSYVSPEFFRGRSMGGAPSEEWMRAQAEAEASVAAQIVSAVGGTELQQC